jgi:sugar lactone lactonase YvrE
MKSGKLLHRTLRCMVLVAFSSVLAAAGTERVTTVVGGRLGDGGSATSASFALPSAVVRDSKGDLYIADANNCRIRRVSAQGIITTFTGTGICGYGGDGGPAKAATIYNVYGMAFDHQGNLLIAVGNRIRSISPDGTISTVAGNGGFGSAGDGGPATKASLRGADGVSVDPFGNIFIADTLDSVIRKVDTAGIIHTVAGNHTSGFSGDGGPATSAALDFPFSVVADGSGNVYIADTNNRRIRKVDATGTIQTYAGTGGFGNTGSGGPATAAGIGPPSVLHLGGGKIYLSTGLDVIWTVNLKTSIIDIVAGNGRAGYNGDGQTALSTSLTQPYGMALDGAGGFYVADSGNNRVRHINSSQIVSTVAGGNVGDGGPATQASLNFSNTSEFLHFTFDPSGNLYVADVGDCRVRKVSPAGTITTFAGTGICGYSGDGGPATSATLFAPQAVAADGSGNVYIADTGNEVIRKVDSTGTITTFVAVLISNGAATSARSLALAVDLSGNLYASDGFFAVWKITPGGAMSVVAGSLFNVGYNGDGIPATQAWLFIPIGLAVDGAGNLFIADWLNDRIRKVDTNGMISTVAGNGTFGFSGDGGPGTSAALFEPTDVAVDTKGNIYIADWINFRIRVVDASGTINTYAGSGGFGYRGNDVLADKVNVFPNGVAVRNNILYFSDDGTYRIRKVH